MKTLIACLLLVATSARAQTKRWVAIGDGESALLRVDTTSAVDVSAYVHRIWVKGTLHRGYHVSPRDARIVRSWLTHYEIDCVHRTFRLGPQVQYDANDRVLSTDDTWLEFAEPMPETVGESVVLGVCKLYHQ